jgi:nucleoside 2-deoxyribosyltransferase
MMEALNNILRHERGAKVPVNIYLAAPFFTPTQLETVGLMEAAISSYNQFVLYSPRQSGIVLKDKSPAEREKLADQVLQENVKQVRWADVVVALIDDRDPGTIWELGLHYGIGLMAPWPPRAAISFSNQNYGLNVMLARSVNTHCQGIEELKKCLDKLANGGIGALRNLPRPLTAT